MSDSCNPVDDSTLSSSAHWISQARILEWVAISSFRGIFLDPGIKLAIPALQTEIYPRSQEGERLNSVGIWGKYAQVTRPNVLRQWDNLVSERPSQEASVAGEQGTRER